MFDGVEQCPRAVLQRALQPTDRIRGVRQGTNIAVELGERSPKLPGLRRRRIEITGARPVDVPLGGGMIEGLLQRLGLLVPINNGLIQQLLNLILTRGDTRPRRRPFRGAAAQNRSSRDIAGLQLDPLRLRSRGTGRAGHITGSTHVRCSASTKTGDRVDRSRALGGELGALPHKIGDLGGLVVELRELLGLRFQLRARIPDRLGDLIGCSLRSFHDLGARVDRIGGALNSLCRALDQALHILRVHRTRLGRRCQRRTGLPGFAESLRGLTRGLADLLPGLHVRLHIPGNALRGLRTVLG
ncbi:hypothetical protein SAMN04488580_109174 [Mycobacterium sp. 283mftsu]|nr:hypothetical protein SAMN04488580_109174 [Mycobacterium sp. 283mftsu]